MLKAIRAKIQKAFYLFGQTMERRNWFVLIICLLVLGFMAMQLPKVRMDTSVEGYLTPDDPHLRDYIAFRNQFGSDDLIVLGIEAQDVLHPGFLDRLAPLHRELAQEVPHLASIISLHNALLLSSREGEVGLKKISSYINREGGLKPRQRQTIMTNPMIKGRLVSADGKLATIIMRIDNLADAESADVARALEGFDKTSTQLPESKPALTNRQNDEVVEKVNAILKRHRASHWRFHLSGTPILKQFLRRAMIRDAALFIKLSLGVICFLLWLIFRRFTGVVLPMLTVAGSVVITVGTMVLFDRPFKAPTIILPSFLLAMGVGASVHLLSIYYRNLREGVNPSHALCGALAHSGLPILLTSITTACGLASFAGAEVAPVADLGLFGALGVMVAFALTVTMLPALISLIPGKPKAGFTSVSYAWQDSVLTSLAAFSQRRRWLIALTGVLLMVLALSGLGKVKFSHNPMAWLPKELPMRQATEHLGAKLGGVVNVEVLIDSGKAGGALQPELLRRVHSLESELQGFSSSGVKVANLFSLADIVVGLNQALTPEKTVKQVAAISGDSKLVAQQILLYENAAPRALAEMTDSDYRLIRMSLTAPWVDAVAYGPFLAALRSKLDQALGSSANVSVTGQIPLMARTLSAAMHSAAQSYIWAGTVITLIILLVSVQIRLGLISMFSNLLPILLALGIMGLMDMPLDLYTMLSGSIAMGLVVDDTIHFMHNFRRYHEQGLTVSEAVRTTMLTTGRAMLITSVVLICGSMVCLFSSLSTLLNFGIVTSSVILMALAADFLLFPALLGLLLNQKQKKERVA